MVIDKLIEFATQYSKEAQASLSRNNHMNELEPNVVVPQEHIDAVLVDFLNYFAGRHCMDLAMYTSDLTKGREREKENKNNIFLSNPFIIEE